MFSSSAPFQEERWLYSEVLTWNWI